MSATGASIAGRRTRAVSAESPLQAGASP
jgi:hypothetical protein